MRVTTEGQLRPFTSRQDDVVDRLAGERPPLAQEEVRGAGVRPQRPLPQLRPQGAQFVPLYRLVRREAALLPPDIEAGGVELDVPEPQVYQLGNPQPVPVGHK